MVHKTSKVLNFRVIVEQDEDGIFIASVPAIPGCYTQGKTYEEVMRRAKEVIGLCLEEAESDVSYKDQIDFSETKTVKDRFLGITSLPIKFKISF